MDYCWGWKKYFINIFFNIFSNISCYKSIKSCLVLSWKGFLFWEIGKKRFESNLIKRMTASSLKVQCFDWDFSIWLSSMTAFELRILISTRNLLLNIVKGWQLYVTLISKLKKSVKLNSISNFLNFNRNLSRFNWNPSSLLIFP